MKKLKNLKILHTQLTEQLAEIDNIVQQHLKKIKQEYNTNLTEEKIKLLSAIANGENLNFEELKFKYLKSKDLIQITNNEIASEVFLAEDLLDKIEFEGKEYYYENKDNGEVYDMESNIVGKFINNKIILN